MSTETEHLKLFKYDTAVDNKELFSIDTALNDNWDILDDFLSKVRQQNVEEYITGDKQTITIADNTKFDINGYKYTFKETTFDVPSLLDTETSLTNGKDYCIYLVEDGSIVISQNSTYPDGYSDDIVKKIGGFHTLCTAVTEANAPALVDPTFWDVHPAIGYDAGDIIPNSLWTNNHRPQCSPSGMVYINSLPYGEKPFWVDIYLQSGTDWTTASVYGGTITNNRQQLCHQNDMLLVGKKLATDNQFLIFSEGSNQQTNIYGSAIPSPASSGGHLDTASKRMISGFFVEECCGYLWQWLDEIAPTGGSSWSNYSYTSKGGSYGMPYVLKAGGNYDSSTRCGSWSRSSDRTRSATGASCGCRGVGVPLS